ncbi:MAG: oligosaccharide flippase family protein [Verrucomicrobiota bacterium]
MSLKKQTLWSMAPLLVVSVVNLVSVPLFYRFLGPERYALWFYVLSVSGAFGFADLGLGVAVGRYVGVELGRGDIDAARGYWGTGNVVAIPLLGFMAIAFAIVGAVFGPRWFNVSPDEVPMLKASFVAAGIGMFFAFYGQFWNILAQVHLDFKFVAVTRVFLSIIQVGGALVIAFWTRNPSALLAWTSLLSIAQLIILMLHANGTYGFGIHWRFARFAHAVEMAGFTMKTFLTLLVNNVLGGLDRLALGKLAPAADFAHYAICSNAGIRISGLSASIMGPIFGQSSRAVGAGGESKAAAIYEEAFDLIFGWLVLISVWSIVWKHTILQLWLGKDLGALVEPLLAPIILAYCITSIANVSGAQLGPLNRVGTGLVIHIFAGILVGICVYVGWRWAGIIGVAYGFLVSRIAFIVQDLFVIRLIEARGWLDATRWFHVAVQVAFGGVFSLLLRTASVPFAMQVCFALLHGGAVAAWLVRKDLAVWLIALRQ